MDAKNTFESLKEDKRKRIINSALEEFSLNNYDKASTNNIVKKAGISKGSLFQYFANKQALYDYLERFCIEIMLEAIQKEMDFLEADLFARIKEIAIIKMEVAKEYPYLIPFAKVIYERKSIEVMKEEVLAKEPNIYQRIYFEGIDFSLFQEGMDIHKAIEITQWVIERISEDYIKWVINTDGNMEVGPLAQKMDTYLEILKQAFYK